MQRDFPSPNYDNIPSKPKKIRPEYIVKKLSEITKGNAYIVTDVGQHQMFTCLHYEYRYPRTQITSGGLGTMGFCLPAAMGIAIQKKDRPTDLYQRRRRISNEYARIGYDTHLQHSSQNYDF